MTWDKQICTVHVITDMFHDKTVPPSSQFVWRLIGKILVANFKDHQDVHLMAAWIPPQQISQEFVPHSEAYWLALYIWVGVEMKSLIASCNVMRKISLPILVKCVPSCKNRPGVSVSISWMMYLPRFRLLTTCRPALLMRLRFSLILTRLAGVDGMPRQCFLGRMSDQTRDTFGNTDEIYFRSFLTVFISFPCLIFTKSLPPTWIKIKAGEGLYNILNCNVDSNWFQCMPDFPIQCTWWLVSPKFFKFLKEALSSTCDIRESPIIQTSGIKNWNRLSSKNSKANISLYHTRRPSAQLLNCIIGDTPGG